MSFSGRSNNAVVLVGEPFSKVDQALMEADLAPSEVGHSFLVVVQRPGRGGRAIFGGRPCKVDGRRGHFEGGTAA